MKSLPVLAIGALALSALAIPAAAQTSPTSPWYMPNAFYGNLGYSNLDTADSPHTDLDAVTGRLGARLGRYFGVEGEITGGVGSDSDNFGGDRVKTRLDDQYAGYLVGFLPVLPHLDLLARVGYGGQQYNVKDAALGTSQGLHYDSVNYGVGGQYSFDPVNGVRVDYTRIDAQDRFTDSNVWSIAYVRKF